MPDWQPNWEDVVFDHAAAQAAISQCKLSAGALDTGFSGFAQAVVALRSNGAWTGSYQSDYDGAQGRLSTDAGGTAADLRTLASAIESAAGKATAEQTRREQDRARWKREKKAEDDARRNRPRGGRVPE
jgi:uncharacterized protein YukE